MLVKSTNVAELHQIHNGIYEALRSARLTPENLQYLRAGESQKVQPARRGEAGK